MWIVFFVTSNYVYKPDYISCFCDWKAYENISYIVHRRKEINIWWLRVSIVIQITSLFKKPLLYCYVQSRRKEVVICSIFQIFRFHNPLHRRQSSTLQSGPRMSTTTDKDTIKGFCGVIFLVLKNGVSYFVWSRIIHRRTD